VSAALGSERLFFGEDHDAHYRDPGEPMRQAWARRCFAYCLRPNHVSRLKRVGTGNSLETIANSGHIGRGWRRHRRMSEEGGKAMKPTYKIAAAVIGSFVLGVGAANVLHAQAKPSGFVLAEIDVKDQDGYTKDFLPKAQANIKESGGKYLAGGFYKAIGLSGAAPPNRVVLIQFPDMDAVKAFYVKEQRLEADVGNKYANFRAIGIEGVEQK
jgi:uncharacterized protein (DUF1330 family)